MTDDRKLLGEHLETATGERVAAVETAEPVAERFATGAEMTAVDVDKEAPESLKREVTKAP